MALCKQSFGSSPLFEDSSAVLDNPNLPLNIPAHQLPRYRDMWKTDKQCLMCGVGFGFAQHKYRCKFCYRAVCNKCSRHRILHPEFNIPRRCCGRCHRRFISSTLREELDAKIFETTGKISVIEEQVTSERINREETEEKVRDLLQEVRRIKLKMSKNDVTFEREIESRKRKLEDLRKIREKLQLKRGKVAVELENAVRRTDSVRKETLEFASALTVSEEQNKVLKAELSRLQEEQSRLSHGMSSKDAEVQCVVERKTVISDYLDTSAGDGYAGEKEGNEQVGKGGEEKNEQKMTEGNIPIDLQEFVDIPIQQTRLPRPIATTQAMAVYASPNRSCCTLF